MSESNLSIVDVGHGSCAVLFDNGVTIVVDCGGRGAALLRYLDDRNITRIKAIFLSHSDEDHIGGLITLLANRKFDVEQVYLNTDASKDSKLWDDLLFELNDGDRKGRLRFEVNIHCELTPLACGDMLLVPVGPSKYLVGKGAGSTHRSGKKITSNGLSATFMVFYKGQPIAFLSGDIDQVGFDDVIASGKPIKARILVFPHHGGKAAEADMAEFASSLLHSVNPETVIFSIGRNQHDTPQPEIVDSIKASGVAIRIACTQLSTRCAAELPDTDPTHLHAFFAKGKPKKRCCAGTFVVEFGETIQEFPTAEGHQKFVDATAVTAICK